MGVSKRLKLDEIGYWSEIKLDIIREYATAYSKVMAKQTKPQLGHIYIDAFAGAGVHLSKVTGDEVPGSPQIAVNIEPPFLEYHFIDLNPLKTNNLRLLMAGRPNVHIYEGDCNILISEEVFPRALWRNYKRGLCVLDPYGLHLNWNVIFEAGQMKSLDVFLNFPIADMNRNVFWRNPEGVDDRDIQRMNAFWGDDSWRSVAYKQQDTLFGMVDEKTDNETIAEAFQERLRTVAGFKHVLPPMPMRNTQGAIVYYLFFASANGVAQKIVTHIFDTYRNRGA